MAAQQEKVGQAGEPAHLPRALAVGQHDQVLERGGLGAAAQEVQRAQDVAPRSAVVGGKEHLPPAPNAVKVREEHGAPLQGLHGALGPQRVAEQLEHAAAQGRRVLLHGPVLRQADARSLGARVAHQALEPVVPRRALANAAHKLCVGAGVRGVGAVPVHQKHLGQLAHGAAAEDEGEEMGTSKKWGRVGLDKI